MADVRFCPDHALIPRTWIVLHESESIDASDRVVAGPIASRINRWLFHGRLSLSRRWA